jgi:hypothetical protein
MQEAYSRLGRSNETKRFQDVKVLKLSRETLYDALLLQISIRALKSTSISYRR